MARVYGIPGMGCHTAHLPLTQMCLTMIVVIWRPSALLPVLVKDNVNIAFPPGAIGKSIEHVL